MRYCSCPWCDVSQEDMLSQSMVWIPGWAGILLSVLYQKFHGANDFPFFHRMQRWFSCTVSRVKRDFKFDDAFHPMCYFKLVHGSM